MSEKKGFWIDTKGVERAIPSLKYPLTKTTNGRILHQYILERDDVTCRICGAQYQAFVTYLNVDHIITRRHGGTHHPRNLQTVCDKCNKEKGWFDRNPAKITELVKAVMEVLKDLDGSTLLWILTMLESAKVVNGDATKRIRILINSGVISGEYSQHHRIADAHGDY